MNGIPISAFPERQWDMFNASTKKPVRADIDTSALKGRFAELAENNPYAQDFEYNRTFWDNLGDLTGLWKSGEKKQREIYDEQARLYNSELLAAQSAEMQEMRYNSPAMKAERERQGGMNPNLTGTSSQDMQAETPSAGNLPAPSAETVRQEFSDVMNTVQSFASTAFNIFSGASMLGVDIANKGAQLHSTQIGNYTAMTNFFRDYFTNTFDSDDLDISQDLTDYRKLKGFASDYELTESDMQDFLSSQIQHRFKSAFKDMPAYMRDFGETFWEDYQNSDDFKARVSKLLSDASGSQLQYNKNHSEGYSLDFNPAVMKETNKIMRNMQNSAAKIQAELRLEQLHFERDYMKYLNNENYGETKAQYDIDTTELGMDNNNTKRSDNTLKRFKNSLDTIKYKFEEFQLRSWMRLFNLWQDDAEKGGVFGNAMNMMSPLLFGSLGAFGHSQGLSDQAAEAIKNFHVITDRDFKYNKKKDNREFWYRFFKDTREYNQKENHYRTDKVLDFLKPRNKGKK